MKKSQLKSAETSLLSSLHFVSNFNKANVKFAGVLLLILLFSPVYGQINFAPCGSPTAVWSSQADFTLCETFGEIQFDLEIGLGSNSGIINSTQLALVLPTLPNPKLKIVGNFSVIDDLVLDGAIIEILPGISIIVEQGPTQPGNLILDGCKLFSCDGLWKGINLLVHRSSITTLNQTRIEDAENAIFSRNTQNTILSISNTIFNRNINGIVLENDLVMPKTAFLSKFYSNTFACTKPLNGTINGITEVGLKLKNINFPFINNALIDNNLYKDIKNGIIAVGATTTLNVRYSKFEKIIENGISFNGKRLSVSNSEFLTIGQNGIYWLKSIELFLQLNKFIETPHSSPYLNRAMINLEAPLPGNNFKIDQNELITLGVLQAKIHGILLFSGGNPISPKGFITKNVFKFYNEFIINALGKESIAIHFVGRFTDQSQIFIENLNEFHLTPNKNSHNTGILLSFDVQKVSCIGNHFYCAANFANVISGCDGLGNVYSDNTFYPTPESDISTAIRMWDSPNNLICNNTNHHAFNVAYVFSRKNFNTTFKGNTTYASHYNSTDLRINEDQNNPAPIIGPQDNNGNKWLPRIVFDQNLQAFVLVRSFLHHKSTDGSIVALSKFTVSPNQSVWDPGLGDYSFFSEYHPATDQIVPDSGPLSNTFFDQGGDSESTVCTTQELNPNTNPVDIGIANGYIGNLIQDDVATWDAKRYLFRKLKQNPLYLNSSSTFNNFFQSEIGSNVGKFYTLEKTIDESMALSPTLDSLNSMLINQSQSLEGQLSNLSDTGFIFSILNQKFIVDTSINSIQNSHIMERALLLQLANSIAQTINPIDSYEIYRKQVLELFLNAHLNQDGILNETQIQSLKSVISLGTNSAGMVTYLAQSFLPICELVPLLESQMETLLQESEDRSFEKRANYIPLVNQTDETVALYPNPATDHFTIALLENENDNGYMEIFATTGELLLTNDLHFGENPIICNLPNGIYAVRVYLNNGKTFDKKIIFFK